MKAGRSKTGKPTIAESGGGSSNTGSATIICGASGEKLRPLFVPKGYSNGEHAIFVVVPGQTHIVQAGHSRSGEWARVERIAGLKGDELILETVGEYEDGDGNIPDTFRDAVDAATRKAHSYHCRSAFFVA